MISAPCSSKLVLQSHLQLELRISYWYFGGVYGLNHNINLLLCIWSFGLKNCSFSSSWISVFKSSLIPKLLIFPSLEQLLGAKHFWLSVQMDFSHSLVSIIGKRLKTNLRCYCHSSIRRKHMFSPLWPQGMVPLGAEFSILRARSNYIFNEAGKCYGFSCQTEVCSHKWRPSVALYGCALCLQGCSAKTHGRSRLHHPDILKQMFLSSLWLIQLPSWISSSSCACLPFPPLGCPGAGGRPAGQGEMWSATPKIARDTSWFS